MPGTVRRDPPGRDDRPGPARSRDHLTRQTERVPLLGWTILTLLFVDELLVMAAYGVWGLEVQGVLLAVVMPIVAMVCWWAFGSPKAPYGGPVRRPLFKTVIFLLGSLALWDAGHPGWAVALLAFSAVINALAQLRFVRDLIPEQQQPAAVG